MPQPEYINKSEIFELLSGQHGGYHRYDFVDHAYLYNLYFPPEDVFSKLKDRMHDLVRNYPVAQDELARLVGTVIDQPAQRIVVGNGASELIKIVSMHKPQRLIIPVPTFNEYVNAAAPGKVVSFPLEYPSFQLDIEKFAAAAIKEKADLAVVVTPNNPTSKLIPKNDLIELARSLASHNCMLMIDESFLDFAENPGDITMEPELDNYPNIAILKSMSKAYGICGLRIGYLLTANSQFAESVRKHVPIWNINGFAEEFLRLLPDYKQDFIESCEKVRLDKDRLYQGIDGIGGMTVCKPDANFVFVGLPDGVSSAPEISRELFTEHNIYVKVCVEKNLPDAHRYLRIASRTDVENRRLVEALIDVLGQKAG